ncbi:hypothetical protein F0U63_11835 [Cystobacter fuscus]|nr:hypothetical protein F0U63_11835 [Cystobacter fuscus]
MPPQSQQAQSPTANSGTGRRRTRCAPCRCSLLATNPIKDGRPVGGGPLTGAARAGRGAHTARATYRGRPRPNPLACARSKPRLRKRSPRPLGHDFSARFPPFSFPPRVASARTAQAF